MKTINDFDFANKIVLLRCDLNSDVKNKKLLKSERIKEASITIKELKKKRAKIVIISHQGRPGDEDFISLKQHCKQLNKYTKVNFVEDIIGKKAERAIKKLKNGEAILLENIRNLKEEFTPDKSNKNSDFFSTLCDIYVNDAFSVCHRKQTSILLPKYIKKSCGGRILEKEIKALQKIKLKNTLYILGGAKPEDNIKLLGKHKVLSCGLFGQVCLINKGKKLGEQENYLKKKKVFIKIPKDKLKRVETPIDFAVDINGRKEISLNGFPNKHEIFDIGSETQKKYVAEIKRASAIYMKGPAGDCSKKGFSNGTFSILKAIADSKAFSVIGGGHLSDAIEASKIDKRKFGHISLSGGALLSYIAGEKLPGLEVLK